MLGNFAVVFLLHQLDVLGQEILGWVICVWTWGIQVQKAESYDRPMDVGVSIVRQDKILEIDCKDAKTWNLGYVGIQHLVANYVPASGSID